MLFNSGSHSDQDISARDSVHNYYERAVFEEILNTCKRAQEEPNFMADVACVALNHLPPRYVRYDVDMTFFLSQVEFEEINEKVRVAVKNAVEYVSMRAAKHPDGPNQSDN